VVSFGGPSRPVPGLFFWGSGPVLKGVQWVALALHSESGLSPHKTPTRLRARGEEL
jgi:hypothetical protein